MTSNADIEQFVCDDIKERQRIGIKKYGTTVADNPLPLVEWLRHAYEEALDQAIYLRRAIAEIEKDFYREVARDPATVDQFNEMKVAFDKSINKEALHDES